MPEGRRRISLAREVPQEIRDFVACTSDRLVLRSGPATWVPIPEDVPGDPVPDITIEPGEAPDSVALGVGFGFVSVDVTLTIVDGAVVATDVPDMFGIKEAIDTFVDDLNADIADAGKRLEHVTVAGGAATITKVALAAPDEPAAAVAAPVTTTTSSVGAAADTEPEEKSGCAKWIAGLLAGLVLVGGALLVTTGGDDDDDRGASPTESETEVGAVVDPSPAPVDTAQVACAADATIGDLDPVDGFPVLLPAVHSPCDPADVLVGGYPLCPSFARCEDLPPGRFVPTDLPAVTHAEQVVDATTGDRSNSLARLRVAHDAPPGTRVEVALRCAGREITVTGTMADGLLTLDVPLFTFGRCDVLSVVVTPPPPSPAYVLAPGQLVPGGSFIVGPDEATLAILDDCNDLLRACGIAPVDLWGSAAALQQTFAPLDGPSPLPGCVDLYDPWGAHLGSVPGSIDPAAPGFVPCEDLFAPFDAGAPPDTPPRWLPAASFSGVVPDQGDPWRTAVWQNTALPCAIGHLAITACPAERDPSPIPTGDLVVVTAAFEADLLIGEEPPSEIAIGFDVDGDAAVETDEAGDALDLVVRVAPSDDGSWSAVVTDPSGAADVAARAMLRGNALSVVVPAASLGTDLATVRHQVLVDGAGTALVPIGPRLDLAVRTAAQEERLAAIVDAGGDGDVDGDPGEPEGPGDSTPTSTTPAQTATTIGSTTTAAPPVTEDLSSFVAALSASISSGDLDLALARLHPRVVEAYGDDCATTLAATADPSFAIEVLSVDEAAPWRWELPDGRSVVVPDAVAAQTSVTAGGTTSDVEAHFAPVDGEWRWFTFCDLPPDP